MKYYWLKHIDFLEIGWFTKYFSRTSINENQSFEHGSHKILGKDVNTCHILRKEIEFW